MPTPRVVQAVVRQRTSLAIERIEANRLIDIAISSSSLDQEVEVHGRDRRTGRPVSAHLPVRDLLVPPEGFVAPA